MIEEEVSPTRDFLHYMAQCLPLLDYDETLIGASAWNENGQRLNDSVLFLEVLSYRTLQKCNIIRCSIFVGF